MNKFSQAGQEDWVEAMTNGKRNGYFVDVGAYDGIESSNTLYLERALGWTGLCIEAGREQFQSLANNRPLSLNINMAVMPYMGTCGFTGHAVDDAGERVPCAPLTEILQLAGAPNIIDYMSIDIEGGEVGAVQTMDWKKYTVNLITIEHNLYLHGPQQKNEIYAILSNNGFVRVVDNAPCLDRNPAWFMQPYEDWYAHETFLAAKH